MSVFDEMLQRAIRHHEAGQIEEAATLYRKLLAEQPSNADALHLLGVTEHQSGRSDAAIELITSALRLQPAAAHFWCNLAEAQRATKRLAEAESSLRRALSLSPRMAEAHNNLALVLDDLGRTDDARREYEAAIQLNPRYFEAWINFARHFGRLGDIDRVAAAGRKALQIDPSSREARVLAGHALAMGGELSAGIELLGEAFAMKPDSFIAWTLANALRERGDHAACVEMQRRAVEMDPANAGMHGKLLYDLHYDANQSPQSIAAEHFAWAQRHADPIPPLPAVHVSPSQHRLRIGYVSGDFRRHAVGQFFRPLLEAHDRDVVEIYCYANNKPDDVTPQFEALADHWRDIRELSDDAAAAMVRTDEIDVLVDLTGHTQGNRLLLFARKPAIVQVTYLGYPDTTGMSAIDYRITDDVSDPPGMTESLQREQLARVHAPFLAYEPLADAPAVAPGPVDAKGYVTFGSFNRPSKISPPAIEAWAKILHGVPRSRMVIKGFGIDEERTRQVWRERLAAAEIDVQRIDLLGLTFHAAGHLRAIASIDIALDTFPYNGTATTCDAMWMGAPVVTFAGATHVSRVGASLVGSVGLNALVAADREGYVQTAIELANDPARVRELRGGLRERMASSPLMDAKRLAREIESLYREWTGKARAGI